MTIMVLMDTHSVPYFMYILKLYTLKSSEIIVAG